jgi:hypothetical protein
MPGDCDFSGTITDSGCGGAECDVGVIVVVAVAGIGGLACAPLPSTTTAEAVGATAPVALVACTIVS